MLVEEKQIEEVLATLSTQGWKILHKELNDMFLTALSNADVECVTNDQWQYRRGELAALRYLLNYENMLRMENVTDI